MNTLNRKDMQKVLSIIALAAVLAACGKSDSVDKKTQLEQLKKQQTELSAEIKKLETELAKNDPEADRKAKFVKLDTITRSEFSHYIEIQGRVEADENVTLAAKAPGTVTAIYVKEGDAVSKGQVLAQLDNKVMLQGVESAKTQLEFATTVFNKQKNLWDQNIGSEIQYLQAKTNKDAAEKQLASMNEQLDMTRIKSPINGIVDEVMLKLGEGAAPGQPAVRVVNLTQLKAKAAAAESYISNVKTGNEVVVVFPDAKKEYKSKVTYAGRAIDNLTRTFNVEVKLPSNEAYRPNMIAVLKIVDYKNPKAFVVPVNIIKDSGEGKYVLVVEQQNGKHIAKKKMVTVGQNYNGMAEITSGLNDGDQVITTGFQDLEDGDIVKLS
jgi:membrane fusion protein, multidrug efflux system